MNKSAKLKHCSGCHDDFYNHGGGGSYECWMLDGAKLIFKKEVSIDQRPPWKQKAKRFLSCYHRPRYIYVDSKREY